MVNNRAGNLARSPLAVSICPHYVPYEGSLAVLARALYCTYGRQVPFQSRHLAISYSKQCKTRKPNTLDLDNHKLSDVKKHILGGFYPTLGTPSPFPTTFEQFFFLMSGYCMLHRSVFNNLKRHPPMPVVLYRLLPMCATDSWYFKI